MSIFSNKCWACSAATQQAFQVELCVLAAVLHFKMDAPKIAIVNPSVLHQLDERGL